MKPISSDITLCSFTYHLLISAYLRSSIIVYENIAKDYIIKTKQIFGRVLRTLDLINLNPVNSNFVTYGKASHYLLDLDLDSVAYLGIGHEDHKSFYSGNAVAFSGNVLNINIVLFSDLYRGRSAHGGSICVIICQNTSPSLKSNQILWPLAKRNIAILHHP